MKHIELASELTYSAHAGDVANKKRVLDDVMDTDALEGQPLQKAVLKSVSALNRLRRMFPDTNRSVRFHKISDFYTLAVLIQTFEAEGLVLTDRRRNKLAWDILVAFGTGVDQVAEALRTLQIKKLEPGQDLCRDYLQTVQQFNQLRIRLLQILVVADDRAVLRHQLAQFAPQPERILRARIVHQQGIALFLFFP